jgi:uncharacterized protein involved in exopolysaccharide biosynthesis
MAIAQTLGQRRRFDPSRRFWLWLLTWPERRHWRRYVLGAAFSMFAIWAAVAVYLQTAPIVYTSDWALVLPGAGAGASIALDSIGQASSVISSPFGSSSLSPKVLYKSIAETPRVRGLAAKLAEMSYADFGEPRIKLIDQTSVMHFSISGTSPVDAQRKGKAFLIALQTQLDRLRQDEIDRRIASVQDSLKGYRDTLEAARRRIVAFQRATGLISIEQFTNLASSLEDLRKSHMLAESAFRRAEDEQARLRQELGISAALAAEALLLSGDQTFKLLAGEYALASAELANRLGRYGDNHPQVVRERARKAAVRAELAGAASRIIGDGAEDWLDRIGLFESPARAELFQRLVVGEAELAGRRAEVETMAGQIGELEAAITERSAQAAELEDLQRDHLVAEAVFSSALARTDTQRADYFASYPLAQVLAEPHLPAAPSSPRPLYAGLGGIAGSLLVTAAWILAWLRQLFVLPRRKSI